MTEETENELEKFALWVEKFAESYNMTAEQALELALFREEKERLERKKNESDF